MCRRERQRESTVPAVDSANRNHTSLREAEKNTALVPRKVRTKPHSSVSHLYRENRPADQIADMRDLPGPFGPNLFSVREVKAFSDENEDLKLMMQ